MTFNNNSLDDHHRRTLFKGWGITDGSVIYAAVRGQGGGKRAMASKGVSSQHDAVLLSTHKMSPVIENLIGHIKDLKDKTDKGSFELSAMVENLSVKDMQKPIANVSANNPDEAKCKTVSDMVFGALSTNVNELGKQAQLAKKALQILVQFVLVSKMSDDYANISWANFTSFLSNAMAQKAKAEDVKM